MNLLPSSIPLKEFWLAIRTNNLERLKQLCEGMNLPTFDDKQQMNHLLAKAMLQSADLNILQFMVDIGVDPRALPRKGALSPLERAISCKRVDYVQFLLDLGVAPNAGLANHRVTLSAIGSSIPLDLQLQFLEQLIAHGVDINFLFPLFGDEENAFTVLDHATHDEVKAFLRSRGALTAKEIRGGIQSAKLPANVPSSELDEVVAYMESLFGKTDEKSFTDIVNVDSGVSVHVIRPQSDDGFFTLFTTGLSRHRMNVTSNAACDGFTELYLQLPSDWDLFGTDAKFRWPAQLLSDLASYPLENNAVFQTPITIITNGDPPQQLHSSVPFTANCLFADKDFKRSDGNIVNLFCVMPLFQSEAEMALRSIPEFLNALDRAGVGRVLDPNRKPIVG
jgi:hypothetical protein